MKKFVVLFLFCFSLVTVVGLGGALAGDDPKVVPDRYIVVLKHKNSLPAAARVPARAKAEGLIQAAKNFRAGYPGVQEKLGSVWEKALYGFSAKLSPKAVEFLEKHPEVDFVEPVVI